MISNKLLQPCGASPSFQKPLEGCPSVASRIRGKRCMPAIALPKRGPKGWHSTCIK